MKTFGVNTKQRLYLVIDGLSYKISNQCDVRMNILKKVRIVTIKGEKFGSNIVSSIVELRHEYLVL